MSHSHSAKITRTRTFKICYCKKCDGRKLVDPRTKEEHESKYVRINFDINNYQEAGPSDTGPSDTVPDTRPSADAFDNNFDVEMEYEPLPMITDPSSERNYCYLTKKLPVHKSAKVKKGKIPDLVLDNILSDNDSDDDDYDDDNDSSENDDDSEDSENDDNSENDDEEEINFALTDFDNDELKLPNIDSNYNYTWIILWILQYQQRYKLFNVAIDSLFKFLRFFLLTIDENKYSSFPSSLYMAKKTLGISTKIIQYAACNKCHKLYDINELSRTENEEIPTCSFINYPNHSMERFRQKCNNPLIKKVDSNNGGQIFCPFMTFPLVNIKQQLTLFFGRKDFEMSCQK